MGDKKESNEIQKIINDLMLQIELRDKMIAEENAQKYEAYKRIAELRREISELKYNEK